MRRFFFNFTSDTEAVNDNGGIELDSLSAAHKHATAMICLAVSSLDDTGLRKWSVEVTDEPGTTLLTVPFFPWVTRRGVLMRQAKADGAGQSPVRKSRPARPQGRR